MSARVLVVGAGLAGTCLVDALLERGVAPSAITWCHGAPGASSSPGALLHALPGRSLDPTDEGMWAFERARAALERWHVEHPELVWRGDMVRPKIPGRLGRRYMNTYARGAERFPECVHHAALDEDALRERVRGILEVEAAVVYGPAFCVDLGELVAARVARARALGVAMLDDPLRALKRAGDVWSARFADHTLEIDDVALCVGAALARVYPGASLARNGGELVIARPRDEDVLSHAISGGGHVAPRADGTWCAGATYLRPDDAGALPSRTDDEASHAVLELTTRLAPGLARAHVERVWRGERLVALDDRHPVCGRSVDGAPWILGALGSKGLLWGPGLAAALARAMTSDEALDVPARADIARFDLGAPRLDAFD